MRSARIGREQKPGENEGREHEDGVGRGWPMSVAQRRQNTETGGQPACPVRCPPPLQPLQQNGCAQGGNPKRFGARTILGAAARMQDGASLASGAIAAAIAPLARRICQNTAMEKMAGRPGGARWSSAMLGGLRRWPGTADVRWPHQTMTRAASPRSKGGLAIDWPAHTPSLLRRQQRANGGRAPGRNGHHDAFWRSLETPRWDDGPRRGCRRRAVSLKLPGAWPGVGSGRVASNATAGGAEAEELGKCRARCLRGA